MSEQITLFDQSKQQVRTLLSSCEDPFTLESFESLALEHHRLEKALIIAEVATLNDPEKPNELTYFYYHANHLNKILFRKYGRSQEYIFRLYALNPLTNTDIYGDVNYYIIEVNTKGALLPVSKSVRESLDAGDVSSGDAKCVSERMTMDECMRVSKEKKLDYLSAENNFTSLMKKSLGESQLRIAEVAGPLAKLQSALSSSVGQIMEVPQLNVEVPDAHYVEGNASESQLQRSRHEYHHQFHGASESSNLQVPAAHRHIPHRSGNSPEDFKATSLQTIVSSRHSNISSIPEITGLSTSSHMVATSGDADQAYGKVKLHEKCTSPGQRDMPFTVHLFYSHQTLSSTQSEVPVSPAQLPPPLILNQIPLPGSDGDSSPIPPSSPNGPVHPLSSSYSKHALSSGQSIAAFGDTASGMVFKPHTSIDMHAFIRVDSPNDTEEAIAQSKQGRRVFSGIFIGTDDDYLQKAYVRQLFQFNAMEEDEATLFDIPEEVLLAEGK
jgi:hypothetical protein